MAEKEPTALQKQMLENIKEIKSQYYVGTKEAFDVLKNIQKMYSNPVEISGIINAQFSKKYAMTYEATPERIVGLERSLILCDNEAEIGLNADEDQFISFQIYKESILGYVNRVLTDTEVHPFMGKTRKAANAFYPFFANANKKRISGDEEFGEMIFEYIPHKVNQNWIKMVFERKSFYKGKGVFAEWLTAFLAGFKSIEWERALSKQALRKHEREYKENLFAFDLSTVDIVQRLFRDQLDHRLEYRRAVGCKWLVGNRIEDYGKAIVELEKKIAKRTEKYQHIKEIDAPGTMIKHSENLIKECKFIRHVLGSDRNFFQRYLRS